MLLLNMLETLGPVLYRVLLDVFLNTEDIQLSFHLMDKVIVIKFLAQGHKFQIQYSGAQILTKAAPVMIRAKL